MNRRTLLAALAARSQAPRTLRLIPQIDPACSTG